MKKLLTLLALTLITLSACAPTKVPEPVPDHGTKVTVPVPTVGITPKDATLSIIARAVDADNENAKRPLKYEIAAFDKSGNATVLLNPETGIASADVLKLPTVDGKPIFTPNELQVYYGFGTYDIVLTVDMTGYQKDLLIVQISYPGMRSALVKYASVEGATGTATVALSLPVAG